MYQKLKSQKREEEAKNNKPGEDDSISSSVAMSMPLGSQSQTNLQQKQVVTLSLCGIPYLFRSDIEELQTKLRDIIDVLWRLAPNLMDLKAH